MTKDDFVALYTQAMNNAIIHGTGFLKIAMVDQDIEISVVDPKDYHYIQQNPLQVTPQSFAEMVKGKEQIVGRPTIWAEWPTKEDQMTNPECWCYECNKDRQTFIGGMKVPFFATRMILCPECGNKRCPKATNHELACTGSNEPGQPGSRYIKPPEDQE